MSFMGTARDSAMMSSVSCICGGLWPYAEPLTLSGRTRSPSPAIVFGVTGREEGTIDDDPWVIVDTICWF